MRNRVRPIAHGSRRLAWPAGHRGFDQARRGLPGIAVHVIGAQKVSGNHVQIAVEPVLIPVRTHGDDAMERFAGPAHDEILHVARTAGELNERAVLPQVRIVQDQPDLLAHVVRRPLELQPPLR